MAVEGGVDEGDGEGAVREKEIIKLWSTEGKERREKNGLSRRNSPVR